MSNSPPTSTRPCQRRRDWDYEPILVQLLVATPFELESGELVMPRCNLSDFNPCGCLAVRDLARGTPGPDEIPAQHASRVDAVPERNGCMVHFNRDRALAMVAAPWVWVGCRHPHLIKFIRTSYQPRVHFFLHPGDHQPASLLPQPNCICFEHSLAPSVAPFQARFIPFPSRAVPAAECTHRCTFSIALPELPSPRSTGSKSWSCSNQSHFLSSRPRTASRVVGCPYSLLGNKRSLSLRRRSLALRFASP
jgi:hypothetical protein